MQWGRELSWCTEINNRTTVQAREKWCVIPPTLCLSSLCYDLFHTSDVGVASSQDPQELVRQLESCLKLNEAHQEQYRLTKTKLQQTPRGKQFDFSETEIFGEVSLLLL